MDLRILKCAIEAEADVVAARQRARAVAQLCGFNRQDQVRIATAVSELARNVFRYAGRGTVEFGVDQHPMPALVVRVEDQGPGIANSDLVLSGAYRSSTGMGLGLAGVRRLMDQFALRSAPGEGTEVQVSKILPPGAPALTAERLDHFHGRISQSADAAMTLHELEQQNTELLQALAELKLRQDELAQMARELEDTNRGVVALYGELDEKAEHLRRADQLKSRFLSNMSHEFRTPLNSIRALGRLLLSEEDGPLNGEQVRQVNYIVKSAESLTELVNDLLDIAKIESGRIDLHAADLSVADMFCALRGMLRPLLSDSSVALVFEDFTHGLTLFSDEAKLSQILRIFISNALMFTEQGEIRVSARLLEDGQWVQFDVADTGIGIAPENHEIIFEEFGQVENPLQRAVRGTGLGLPLCRKLAELLGGRVALKSALGKGSTFSAVVPARIAPSHSGQLNRPEGDARRTGAHQALRDTP